MSALAALLFASVLMAPSTEALSGSGNGPLSPTANQPDGEMESDAMSVWRSLVRGFQPPTNAQVRIERRVIMRVWPRPSNTRDSLTALAPIVQSRVQLEERDFDGCVPLGTIAAAQPRGKSQLLLYLRDRTLVAADLERSCSANDFYSGFYVERSNDGHLCPRRDKILSRSGARCELSEFHRLVAARD